MFGAGLGDAEVVTDVVVARRKAQRPIVIEDGLADTVILEIGIAQVIIEFHGAHPARKQLFVGIGGRMEIAVDIGRIGFVPQLLRSLLPGGLRLGRGFPGNPLQAVGRLLRKGYRGQGQRQQKTQDHSFHGVLIFLSPLRSGK